MFAHVTNLRYWKSERADLTTCEDASRADPRRGLFCVSDGAGTTLFSNIWAEILVEHFTRAPLVSLDAFEMEWWIRQAQKRYRELAPQADRLNWNARQKAVEQGAYATLAALRFLSADEQSASAELLAIGDSCVIIGHATRQTITAFPLQHPTDFDRAPYCVPALLKNLNRKTLYAKRLALELAPGDTIILASDAVARWIIGGGAANQENSAWDAFQEVAQVETDLHWRELIDACRANQSMVDDDATAVIIRLLVSGQPEQTAVAAALGYAAGPLPEVVAERKAEFERALAEKNKELIAILYGDGQMLKDSGLALPSADEIARAREVADAMREVLQAMREAIKAANFAAKMEPVWRRYADLLIDEPCAESMRKTLASQGVQLRQPPSQAQSVPQIQFVPQPRFAQPGPPPFPVSADAQAPLSSFAPEQVNLSLPQLSGHEAEPARVFSPAPAAPDLARLRQALNEGTPQEKIAAWLALAPEHSPLQRQLALQLNTSEQLQLDLARRLINALQADNSAQIYAAYDEIEKLALLKHFSLSAEDQQRVREAQSTRASIEQLRAVLRNDGKSVSLLVNVYQTIHAPQSFLSREEQRVLAAAQEFARLDSDDQQTVQVNNPERVYHYDQLFFSPYRFTFDARECFLIEHMRAFGNIGYPGIAKVNQTIIDSAQFFTLYLSMPYHARAQIRGLVDLRSRERSEVLIHQHNQHITYWQRQIEPYGLAMSVLHELLYQVLIEQAISEDGEKSWRALEKEIQKMLDEWFKEIRAALEKDERKSLLPLGEQYWRNALLPYARRYAMDLHLQPMPPGQTLDTWLRERKSSATILYYQRLEDSEPTTPDPQECWLFSWWFLRQPPIRPQQGEIEHA
ncbi:MAG TPA: protein phosphatase 2C domain-containing protein [Ktedonobacteraceae bacterium]